MPHNVRNLVNIVHFLLETGIYLSHVLIKADMKITSTMCATSNSIRIHKSLMEFGVVDPLPFTYIKFM